MTLTIELTPGQEAALQAIATEAGLKASEYAWRRLASDLAELTDRTYTASELLQMPAEERSRYLRAAAELAAPEYEADLALPPQQRELAAISAIVGRDFLASIVSKWLHNCVTCIVRFGRWDPDTVDEL